MLRQSFIPLVVGLFFVSCAFCRAGAEDKPPTAGKSKIVAAPSLKNVETFRRKVVFFTKDVDLPCLRVPANGGQPPDFDSSVHGFDLPGGGGYSCSAEMTKDGDLVFLNPNMILRVNKKGLAEKMVSLKELTVKGVKSRRESLHFQQLLGVSTTAPVLYVIASTEPEPEPEPESEHEPGVLHMMSDDSYYVGKLDLTTRKLLLMPCEGPADIALDPDAGIVYQSREASVECHDFNGKARGQWPVSNGPADLVLSPDKRTMLLSPTPPPPLGGGSFSLLELKSGHETDLPISRSSCGLGGEPDALLS